MDDNDDLPKVNGYRKRSDGLCVGWSCFFMSAFLKESNSSSDTVRSVAMLQMARPIPW